ncbi:GNAT family N-acetyltransferase [Nonomuraea mesophila]|uniref:GNAT family N-acetyltransferase n=1 Tax=Nonomuraea mesophila TaxID=2530382 RepID=A0A4R5EGX8_9ACTN|nr:GNAT family N-acetyltransferase [Nonomuraea mesophila]TDE33695.1 GNAT family N-acetyltransferase [Nonomuraea mesophila]
MRSITPLESKHALDLDGLREPGVTFWSVVDGDTIVGCGAIKRLDAGHAEVKSMRTSPARRQSGVASLLLKHIIAEARRMGFTRLSLETGSATALSSAASSVALLSDSGSRAIGQQHCCPVTAVTTTLPASTYV